MTKHEHDAIDAALRGSIDRVLIGGNHLATWSADWPSWQLEGITREQQCENALRVMGATKEYDMWVCWSTLMQERDTLQTTLALVPAGESARAGMRSADEIRAEIEQWRKRSDIWKAGREPIYRELVTDAETRILALEWVLPPSKPQVPPHD